MINEKKDKPRNKDMKDDLTGMGRQGFDKAPDEDPPRGNEEKIREVQKATKVDGDPSKETDRPDD